MTALRDHGVRGPIIGVISSRLVIPIEILRMERREPDSVDFNNWGGLSLGHFRLDPGGVGGQDPIRQRYGVAKQRSAKRRPMSLPAFSKQVFEVAHLIISCIECNPPTQEIDVPKDWPALQSIVRGFAAEIMMSPSVEQAIESLKRDPLTLICVLWLTKRPSDPEIIEAVKLAYESQERIDGYLPCEPYASYLLVLCDEVEIF